MVPNVPITGAYIGSLLFQTFFFGLSTTTYLHCLSVLICNAAGYKSSVTLRRGLTVVATVLYINATINTVRLFLYCLDAFVNAAGEPGKAESILFNPSHPLALTFGFIYTIQTLLGDATLVFRTWAVYNRQWLPVALPCLLLLADLVLGVYISILQIVMRTNPQIGGARLLPFITAYVAITLTCNTLCTAMITGKIWLVSRRSARLRQGVIKVRGIRRFNIAARIVLESGLLYSTTTAIQLSLAFVNNAAAYTVADCTIPIIAICFHMIIVRANWLRVDADRRGPSILDDVVADGGTRTLSLAFVVPASSTQPTNETDSFQLMEHQKSSPATPSAENLTWTPPHLIVKDPTTSV